MPKSKREEKSKPKKEQRDFAQIAFDVVQKATGQKIQKKKRSR